MGKFQFTPQAISDLFEIWSFIAKDDPTAADRIEDAIFDCCDLIAQSPMAGTVREDLTSLQVRFWVVHSYPNYLIVYRAEKKPIQILRVLHAARDVRSLLR